MTFTVAQFKSLVGKALSAIGCQKVGTRWCRSQGGVGLAVGFYKLRGQEQYRIEISIETRTEFQAECRHTGEGSILMDADDLRFIAGQTDPQSFDDLLDFGKYVPAELRRASLERAIDEILIPGLAKVTSRTFLKSPEGDELLQKVLVTLDADI